MTNDQGRLIAAEAKTALTPFGFRRRGQSRLWLADRGFWLAVVEFQPSGWAKGSYLNVAAHWLWNAPPPILSFDHSERVGGVADASDADFPHLMATMAAEAAETTRSHQTKFYSLPAVAEYLIETEQMRRPEAQGDWGAYHAGIAAGLTEQWSLARTLLSGLHREQQRHTAEKLVPALGSPEEFKSVIQSLINGERAHYGLPPWRLP